MKKQKEPLRSEGGGQILKKKNYFECVVPKQNV